MQIQYLKQLIVVQQTQRIWSGRLNACPVFFILTPSPKNKSFFTISKTRKQHTQRYKSPGARCSSELNMQRPSGFVKTHWTKAESLPSSLPTKTASSPLCFALFETNQRKGCGWGVGEVELGWDEGGGWGAFWPSFTLSVLLAGDSVQDLLITTQWSSNPTDVIDSDCCSGLTALPNPPSMLSLPL